MKTTSKIAIPLLLMTALLALITCVQPEQGAVSPKPAADKKAPAKTPPVKIKYLTGEIISVNKAQKTITVRAKDAEAVLHTDVKTTIKVNGQPGTISDLSAGMKATVRYVSVYDSDWARSVVISPPPASPATPTAPMATRPPEDKEVTPWTPACSFSPFFIALDQTEGWS